MPCSQLLTFFVGGEIVDLVLQSGAVAKFVLILLLAFSVISWAIILSKWSLLRRARVQSGRFVRAFRKAQRIQDVSAVSDQFRPSPLVGVFENGFEEFKRQISNPTGTVRNPLAIQRAMQIASSEEVTRLERNMPWLAITAAVTMPQRMLLSLSLVAAAVKSRALAPDASTGCRLAALSPCPRFQKSGLIGSAGQSQGSARACVGYECRDRETNAAAVAATLQGSTTRNKRRSRDRAPL